jgi:hypothetical protein
MENGKNATSLNNSINDLKSKKGEYQTVLSEISELEKSEQKYAVKEGNVSAGTGGHTQYNKSTDVVEAVIGKESGVSTIAHELKHCHQFEKREISFDNTGRYGGSLYDLTDEKAAYNRGALFGGSTYSLNELKSMYPGISNSTESKSFNSTKSSRYGVYRNHDIMRKF